MATSARAPGRLWQPQEALHTEPVSTSCLSGLGQRTAFSFPPTRKEPWAALAAPGWPPSRGRQVWGGGTPPQPWADTPYVTFPSRSLDPRWGTGQLRAHWCRPQDPPLCAVKAVTAPSGAQAEGPLPAVHLRARRSLGSGQAQRWSPDPSQEGAAEEKNSLVILESALGTKGLHVDVHTSVPI